MNTFTSRLSQADTVARTFQWLALSMVPTGLGVWLMMQWAPAFSQSHPFLFIGGLVLNLIVSIALIFYISKQESQGRESVAGMGLMWFAFSMGLSMGPLMISALHRPQGLSLVLQAVGMTGAIFAGLTAYVSVTKKDFSFLQGFLFAGLMVLIVGGIINIFLGSSVMHVVMSAMGALIFTGYILMDSSAVFRREIPPVFGALSLYLDIINLFMNLLQLLMSLGGSDD